jgi:xylulokinase
MRDLVLGLDSSTTAVKVIVWDLMGQAVASGRQPIDVLQPHPGWHEQPAESWWTACCAAIQQAIANIDVQRLAGLSISHQRETFVPVDFAGTPVRNAILWMDERAGSMLAPLAEKIGDTRFQQITGKPLTGNLSLVKIAWLKAFEPDIFVKAAHWLDTHAYLVHKLTGRYATGWGCADPTGMLDIQHGCWSADICRVIDLSIDTLPDLYPPGAMIAPVNAQASDQTGLPEGLPVFAGIGDGQAAALGMNITRPGDAALSLGTSAITDIHSSEYHVSRAFRTTCGGTPGSYLYEMVLLGGTYTLDWYLSKMNPGPAQADLESAARQVPAGADGLLLVPYWNTAMNPYWDAHASGVVMGWRGHHHLIHLYRAILEGIALELRLQIQGAEQALGDPVKRIVVTGGGSKNTLWMEIIANVLGIPVSRSRTPESAALGAGILAAAGSGLFADVPTAAQSLSGSTGAIILPDASLQSFYSSLYQDVYVRLYPSLKEGMANLSNITARHRGEEIC